MLWVIIYLFLVLYTLYSIPFKRDNESAKLVFFLSLLGLSFVEIIYILDNTIKIYKVPTTLTSYIYLILFLFNSIFFYIGLSVRHRKKFYLWSIALSALHLLIALIGYYIYYILKQP